jgi:hypothetical protein
MSPSPPLELPQPPLGANTGGRVRGLKRALQRERTLLNNCLPTGFFKWESVILGKLSKPFVVVLVQFSLDVFTIFTANLDITKSVN